MPRNVITAPAELERTRSVIASGSSASYVISIIRPSADRRNQRDLVSVRKRVVVELVLFIHGKYQGRRCSYEPRVSLEDLPAPPSRPSRRRAS